ncbi:MAG: HAD family acid phosphatase [Actinomycetota bacterium]
MRERSTIRVRAVAAAAIAAIAVTACNTTDAPESGRTGASTTTQPQVPPGVVAPFPNDDPAPVGEIGDYQLSNTITAIEQYGEPLIDLDLANGLQVQTYGQASNPSPYYQDQVAVVRDARACVDAVLERDQPARPAVIFDVDETALSAFWMMAQQDLGFDVWLQNSLYLLAANPAIEPTREWFNDLFDQNVQPILVTGRSETLTVTSPLDGRESELAIGEATTSNLVDAGFQTGGPHNPDLEGFLLFFQPIDHSGGVGKFKADTRAELADDFDLVGNIGDQFSDLTIGDSPPDPPIECSYKMPNPFYFIPSGGSPD